jgi:Tol biopolymer transport system component/tRNA A-37 threonylcarbamoyl transferase component Bud32
MSVDVGTRLGSLEITALLGKGGMGEVYRARDTKLKRDVAIKILPEEFSRDEDRLSRFQREAEILASLNHPNIAAIYSLEEANGSRYLVLELVEGQTLADRLKRGPPPIDEAVTISKHICEAIEAAHEKGIIHRDLKPANIKLTSDGIVKVLDFGLAKVREAEAQASDLSNSPTLMTAASARGMILGTAAYMSPEQAKGQEANRTSDVWAFGCVLYEMLTGRPPFEGETVSEVFAGILKADPDWKRLPTGTPENIRRLLLRCLRKERRFRLQHIGDARLEIEEIEEPQSRVASQFVPRRRERLAWATGLVVLAVLAAAMGIREFRGVPPAAEMRVEISTAPTADLASIAISPDGRKIVFVATSAGQSKLWVRPLDSVSGRALAGTDGAFFPFWSPDSQSVGFFAEGKLKRVDVDRGAVQILAEAPAGRGGSWNREGTIIFTPNALQSPILRILATGGTTPSAVTRLETTKETNHRFPQFLPDGHHFLYYVLGTAESHGVYVGDLDGSRARRLIDVDSAPVYESSGHLFFVRQGTLFAQEFDVARLELKGNPFSVAERIGTVNTAAGSAAVSASSVGPIIYRTALAGGQRQFLWLDRSGKEIGKAGDPLDVFSPSISRDNRRVVFYQAINNNFDVWLLDLGRNVLSRFTSDAAADLDPIWSPDGRRIAFRSNRKGAYDLYIKPATGPGSEELLLASGQDKRTLDWSPDGRFLLYADLDPKTGIDIWALPIDGDRKPFPVVRTNFEEDIAQFSPDGKWIAYQSNESGRYEIHIQPFPGPGGHTPPVSTNGGAQVRWRSDGKELFYIALDGRLMAVPIRIASNAQTIEAGSPVPLFATRVGGALFLSGIGNQQYDVSLDGQRFLMNTIIEEAPSPITVILNWKAKP